MTACAPAASINSKAGHDYNAILDRNSGPDFHTGSAPLTNAGYSAA